MCVVLCHVCVCVYVCVCASVCVCVFASVCAICASLYVGVTAIEGSLVGSPAARYCLAITEVCGLGERWVFRYWRSGASSGR